MNTIIFDIETGPLPEAELTALLPPFDPEEVKMGNTKDPVKVAAKLAEAEANHLRNFIDRAALDPLTGRVIAVGLLSFDTQDVTILGHDDEARTLAEFWTACTGNRGTLNRMVGFNSNQFDLPFLIRRSWKHNVTIPMGIRRGRYWSDQMLDLRDLWQLGDRYAIGSLDAIARHLGVGAKNGDGKEFAALWAKDRRQAEAYLRNDLELTAKVGCAIGALGY